MITTITAALTKKREENEKGFTLIELLVVILIIGVLAAIAIPAFLNQRQGAWESQVKSDLANAVIAAETFSTKNNGAYKTTATPAVSIAGDAKTTLASYGFKATPDVVTTVVVSADGKSYTLSAKHASLTNAWVFDSTTGLTTEKVGS